MGLFNNPKKAMKGFFRDPIGKVCTDINRAVGIEKKMILRKQLNVKNNVLTSIF